jgi:hypothetical protein
VSFQGKSCNFMLYVISCPIMTYYYVLLDFLDQLSIKSGKGGRGDNRQPWRQLSSAAIQHKRISLIPQCQLYSYSGDSCGNSHLSQILLFWRRILIIIYTICFRNSLYREFDVPHITQFMKPYVQFHFSTLESGVTATAKKPKMQKIKYFCG